MLNQERVRECLKYDLESGILTWIVSTSNRVKVGGRAGWLGKNGYWYVDLDGKSYLVSRIIWLYMTGAWPAANIDHRDRDSTNNRWKNLREATYSQNEMNKGLRGGLRGSNTSGIKGVSFDKASGKWAADIKARGVRYRLGRFSDKEEAAASYKTAALKLHGEFACI